MNIFSSSLVLMPTPVSEISNETFMLSYFTRTKILPFSGVNLKALDNKLNSAFSINCLSK